MLHRQRVIRSSMCVINTLTVRVGIAGPGETTIVKYQYTLQWFKTVREWRCVYFEIINSTLHEYLYIPL